MKKINEKKLKRIVSEAIKKVLNEENGAVEGVRPLNMKGTYNGNRYISFNVSPENTIFSHSLNEEIRFEPDSSHKGGMIVFSTDVNSIPLSNNAIVNKFKQFFKTWQNRLTATHMIDNISISHKVGGWTIGHFLNGRYKDYDTGEMFSENSLSLEIAGIDSDELMQIARELCNVFKQQTVMVKDYSTLRIMFVDDK